MLLRIQKRINSHDLLLSEIQIDNLNEDLNKWKLSLRSPKNYVDHLVEKYTEEKRDTNSLQVGLKLRIRMGNLVLTDEEINTINEAYNFELIQRAELKHKREKFPLLPKYIITGNLKESTKEMLQNPEALVRRVIKKKSNKLTPLDIRLFNILEDK